MESSRFWGTGMKKGRFIGVGTGPGDPELMTFKAVKIIEEADIIMIPAKDKESCRAYRTASGACPGVEDKECICEPFPMKMDKEELEAFHIRTADRAMSLPDKGMDIAFLVIGDPSVYSTFDYVERIVRSKGYRTERVSGIPSFIAAADRLDISLGEDGRPIHIIPGSGDIDKALNPDGTRVFMKTGKKLANLKKALIEYEKEGGRVAGVYGCSLPEEELVYGAENIPDDWGYLNVVIAD
jgi:precorrin-2 C(20)-methyltransferase